MAPSSMGTTCKLLLLCSTFHRLPHSKPSLCASPPACRGWLLLAPSVAWLLPLAVVLLLACAVATAGPTVQRCALCSSLSSESNFLSAAVRAQTRGKTSQSFPCFRPHRRRRRLLASPLCSPCEQAQGLLLNEATVHGTEPSSSDHRSNPKPSSASAVKVSPAPASSSHHSARPLPPQAPPRPGASLRPF
jgi:hypothetical protein